MRIPGSIVVRGAARAQQQQRQPKEEFHCAKKWLPVTARPFRSLHLLPRLRGCIQSRCALLPGGPTCFHFSRESGPACWSQSTFSGLRFRSGFHSRLRQGGRCLLLPNPGPARFLRGNDPRSSCSGHGPLAGFPRLASYQWRQCGFGRRRWCDSTENGCEFSFERGDPFSDSESALKIYK